MATQGLITITKNGRVEFKCIAGCNGMTASATAKEILKLGLSVDTIYEICLANKFGCKDCLVVMSDTEERHADDGEPLPEAYRENFLKDSYNPRRANGAAPHHTIIIHT